MAFAPTHAMAAVALGSLMAPRPALPVFLVGGAVCSMLPDVDLLAPLFTPAGREAHRSFTHSVFFAVLAGVVIARCCRRWSHGSTKRLAIYLTLAMVSHSVLDALTTYDMGVAFLSPVSSGRLVSPWRPISSGSVEFWNVFVPLVLVTGLTLGVRGIRAGRPVGPRPLTIRSPSEPSVVTVSRRSRPGERDD